MDHNDRQAIEDLFGKLARVESQSGPRDAEAERFIRTRIDAQPAAAYLMAQTIVVQEQALTAAQGRLEELEYQLSQRQNSGGFLSSILGGGSAMPRRAPANSGRYSPNAQTPGPWGQSAGGYGQQRRGGGFLAGAAQTAMGVAGGVLLGSAIGGMFAGGGAEAANTGSQDDAGSDDAGADDSDI